MPDTAVTHEQLRAGQMALIERFTEHERHFRDVSIRLFDKLDQTVDAGHNNAIAITKLDGQVAEIVTSRHDFGVKLDKIENTVKDLVADGNRREGREGVIAAIMRSPFIAWFAAFGAVLWAAIRQIGTHMP